MNSTEEELLVEAIESLDRSQRFRDEFLYYVQWPSFAKTPAERANELRRELAKLRDLRVSVVKNSYQLKPG